MLIFYKPICFLKSCFKNIACYLVYHSRYATCTHDARIRHSVVRFKVLERRLWRADISITVQIISNIVFQHTLPSNKDHLSVQNYFSNLNMNQSGLRQSGNRSKSNVWQTNLNNDWIISLIPANYIVKIKLRNKNQ